MDPVNNELESVKRTIQAAQLRVTELEDVKAKRQKCDGSDIEEAICYLKTKFMNHEKVCQHFEGIGSNPDFWRAFLEAKEDIPLVPSLWMFCDYKNQAQTEDWNLVKQLCLYDPALVDGFYSNNEEVQTELARKVVDSYPFACAVLGRFFSAAHPESIASAFKRPPPMTEAYRQFLINGLPQSVWQDREVVIAWGQNGQPYMSDLFSDGFRDDKEVALAFLGARSPDERSLSSQFRTSVSDKLRADKEFMLQAVRSDPILIKCVSDSLKDDQDLLVAAFTNERGCFMVEYIAATALASVANFVHEKLRAYDLFFKFVLCEMSPLVAKHSTSSSFVILDQGSDTSLVYKERIAEYLGIPKGKKLQDLRLAAKTLAFICNYPWKI